ncbi:MAG: YceD family protein [Dehalococcoidia bacterium]
MRVNVAEQLKGETGDVRRYSFDEISEGGYAVQGELVFTRTHRSILVTGKLRAVVTNTCSRCLQEFEQVLDFELQEEFFPPKDIFTGVPVPSDEGSEDVDGFSIGEDNILDLGEAVRQNMIISLPQKPLCSQGCAGLCSRCGHNLNYGMCDCTEELDQRWAPLGTLFAGELSRMKKEV